ncbi:MAG TPA: hypothetical protein VFU06_06885 [Longimicrobiales bacterium]|nr:hypothetical protein [Longimicrobiales bacterium]
MILHATRHLVEGSSAGSDWHQREVLLRVVGRLGSHEDARALQQAVCEDPQAHADVVPALMVIADQAIAAELFASTTTADGMLRDGMPEDLLHLFGYCGLQQAEPMLWRYARGDDTWTSECEPAVRGLLHLPCTALREEIATTILSYRDRSLFAEYLPALAVKTGRTDLLDVLVAMGETASTDCNAGIVLGIALYGEAARDRFAEIVWSPEWEADGTGTGTVRATHDGLCVLGVSMRDLVVQWKQQIEAGTEPLHGAALLTNLLGERLQRPHTGLRFAPRPPDTFAEVHAALYGVTHADTLPVIARAALERAQYPFTDLLVGEIETLEEAVLARMAEEALLAEARRA